MRYLFIVAALLAALTVGMNKASAEVEYGEASYYSWELAGNPTATGELYDPMGITVAHPWLPLNSYVTVCYEVCVVARVNDRGPYYGGRIVDFSEGTARATGLYWDGVGFVSVWY